MCVVLCALLWILTYGERTLYEHETDKTRFKTYSARCEADNTRFKAYSARCEADKTRFKAYSARCEADNTRFKAYITRCKGNNATQTQHKRVTKR